MWKCTHAAYWTFLLKPFGGTLSQFIQGLVQKNVFHLKFNQLPQFLWKPLSPTFQWLCGMRGVGGYSSIKSHFCLGCRIGNWTKDSTDTLYGHSHPSLCWGAIFSLNFWKEGDQIKMGVWWDLKSSCNRYLPRGLPMFLFKKDFAR